MTDFKFIVLFKRFLRGGIAGAVGSMATLVPFSGSSLVEIKTWLFMLAIAGATGFISGGILALDKFLRWEDEPKV